MALGNSSISSGRAKTSNIRKSCNEVRATMGNLKIYLKGNENYQKFVTGTDKGQKLDEKLQKILNLMDQNLTAQTTNITMKLNSFFNYQEELNKKSQITPQ